MKLEVKARNRTHQFNARAGENILHAGLANAIDLPYECGSGTCGTCKAHLISGQIHDAWPQAPGRKVLKTGDDFLMCQCEARDDAVFEVAKFIPTVEVGTCLPASLRGCITAVEALTTDILQIDVALSGTMGFDAGQFVLVRFPDVVGARGWSMVNYQRGANALRFIVKRKPDGGLSARLFSGPGNSPAADLVGLDIEVYGPLGRATFSPSMAKNLLCIAGGSGIAGMMSILERAALDGYFTQYRGDVFFGVRTFNDAFLLGELSSFVAQCGDKLKVTIALSDAPPPDAVVNEFPKLKFDQGLVHEVAGRAMEGRYQNVRAYLAGPPPAVDASIRMLLLQAKLTPDNIRYDKFS
jgi:toluene monooxygenase electron transfer component